MIMSATMECFLATQGRVRNSRGKRAIGVRAIEVLLYCGPHENSPDEVIIMRSQL